MPKTLTKKDIKGVFVSTLQPFAKAVRLDFKKVNNRLDGVEVRLSAVEVDLKEVKEDLREMRQITSQVFQKLDELITLYKKQEQEMLSFGVQPRRMEERIGKLEAKQSHRLGYILSYIPHFQAAVVSWGIRILNVKS